MNQERGFFPKTFWIVTGSASLLFTMLALVCFVENSAGAKPARPPITWTPQSINSVVFSGVPTNLNATFVSSEDLSDVRIGVVPELEPYVQVTPAFLPQVRSGQTVPLTLTVLTPPDMLPRTLSGTVHLRGSQQTSTIATPLPISIVVQWQHLKTDQPLDFSVIYPPTYIPTVNNSPGFEEVGFSENQDSQNVGLPPVFVITFHPLPSGQTTRDWIHSLGVGDESISDAANGNVKYLRWSESGGEGDASAVSYTTQAPNGDICTVTVHSARLLGSPALNIILSSLSFKSQ